MIRNPFALRPTTSRTAPKLTARSCRCNFIFFVYPWGWSAACMHVQALRAWQRSVHADPASCLSTRNWKRHETPVLMPPAVQKYNEWVRCWYIRTQTSPIMRSPRADVGGDAAAGVHLVQSKDRLKCRRRRSAHATLQPRTK